MLDEYPRARDVWAKLDAEQRQLYLDWLAKQPSRHRTRDVASIRKTLDALPAINRYGMWRGSWLDVLPF